MAISKKRKKAVRPHRLLRLFLFLSISVGIFLTAGDSSNKTGQVKEKPDLKKIEREDPAQVQMKRMMRGQVEVRFREEAVPMFFSLKAGSKGLERLKLTAKEHKILEELQLSQVVRLLSSLEVPGKIGIRVMTDRERRVHKGRKARSAVAKKAFIGIERDMLLFFPPSTDMEKVCRKLRRLPSVESCTPRYIREPLAPVIPNDPDFNNQWGFHNTAVGGPAQAPNFDIDAPEAWENQKGDASVVVAVIDTDVDVRHRDLYEKIWINIHELPAAFVSQVNAASADNWPGILTFIDLNSSSAAMVNIRGTFGLTDANGNGYIDGEDLYNLFQDGIDGVPGQPEPAATAGKIDDIIGWNFSENTPLPFSSDGHGTAVAGLVGAMTDNNVDTAGVGWNTRIMAIRGDWSWPSVEYAMNFHPAIITSSLPGNRSTLLNALLEDLESEGIVFCTSLGNIDRYIGGTGYAESPYTIAVSNFRSTGTRAFSGGSSYSVNSDVAGPGSGTYSLALPSGTLPFSGTSGANPIVAGILSLMIAERGDLTPEQLRQVLRQSAVDIPAVTGDQGENTAGFDYYSGWGLANAKNALDIIGNNPAVEAKITTQGVTYFAPNRQDEFHIIDTTSPVNAFAGIPGGPSTTVKLEHAPGPPPVSSSAWTVLHDASSPYIADAAVTTLTRANLAGGINSIRLTVTSGGKQFQDFGRVDVPHAYLDIEDNTMFTGDFSVRGFAFHPDFSRCELQVASGHNPDQDDDSLWSRVGTSLSVARPPAASGSWFTDRELFASVPLADLHNGAITLRLAVFNSSNTRVADFSVPAYADTIVFPHQSGFPVNLGWPFRMGGAAAYDLTGDGNLELIVTNQVTVHVYRRDGTELPGWPADVGDNLIVCSPAIGDVTGDGLPEIVVRGTDLSTWEDTLYVFKRNGTPLTPWPVNPSTSYSHNGWPTAAEDRSPVLADLDADGDLEILMAGKPTAAGTDAAVQVFQGNGTLWHRYGPTGAEDITTPPAVGDVDGDGQMDVVFVSRQSGAGSINIWRADGSEIGVTAMSSTFNTAHIDLVSADLDGDDDLEIVVLRAFGQIIAYHHDGTVMSGWNNLMVPNVSRSYAMSCGDLLDDGSDNPQVIVSYHKDTDPGTPYTPETGLYVIKADGTAVSGWGSFLGDGQSSQQPTIFDCDDDGKMEVLFGPRLAPEGDPFAVLKAFNHDGTAVSDNRFPIYLPGGVPRSPVIADLDGDNDLELGIASNGWAVPVDVFDLPTPGDAAIAWGMQRHDPMRTNNYHGGIRILEPNTTRPTDVGPAADAPNRHLLLIRLRKEIPYGTLTGASDLTVKIGTETAPVAEIRRVEGEHWLLVTTPDQPANGDYKLEIQWNDGGIKRMAGQKNAVRYSGTSEAVDHVLVVDRSGSMNNYEKYLAARTAGNFYVNAGGAQDNVGLVSFNTAATDDIPGTLVLGADGSTNRGTVANKIDNITLPADATSIGAGLKMALEDVLPPGQSGRSRALVLLSDGLENTAPFWDMGANPVRQLFEQAANNDVVIHTIALGPDADRDLHGAIAAATGGTARFVYLGNSLSIYGRLADAYKQVEEIAADMDRLFTKGETIPLKTTRTYNVFIPYGTRTASFAMSYREKRAAVKMEILDPADNPVTGTAIHGPTSVVTDVPAPAPGVYRVRVTPLKSDAEVLTTVSARLEQDLIASLAWLTPTGIDAVRGTIIATTPAKVPPPRAAAKGKNFTTAFEPETKPGFMRGLKMRAKIVAPDKSVTVIPLLDNGDSRDGESNDGVYAAQVLFDQGGGYAVTIQVLSGREPVFEKTIGYYQARVKDNDLDGILDAWELKHFPGRSIKRVNPLADHDRDGLNTLEEFRYRTAPLKYDSDGDGRPDGIEVDGQTDPLKANPVQPQPGDRDGDGITDKWETRRFPGKKPEKVDASADPDNDNLSNYTEYKLGTDPNRSDSNGNGISDDIEAGWEVPGPMTRTWHPVPQTETQPEPGKEFPHWLIILLIILLVLLILYVLKRLLRR